MKNLVVFLSLLVTVTVSQPVTARPQLTSTGTVHRVVEGDRAVLPCRVTDLGDFVLLWRRDTRVMFAGAMKVRRDERLSLAETDLVLDKVEMGDRGDYTCQVETGDESPPMIVHTLEVLQPPKIRSKPDNGFVIVKEGTTVILECEASGNPTPTVSWRRGDTVLEEGEKLVLEKMDRNGAGDYHCTASNGLGTEDTAKFIVEVLCK